MALSLLNPGGASGSLYPIIKLIPWDPDSEEQQATISCYCFLYLLRAGAYDTCLWNTLLERSKHVFPAPAQDLYSKNDTDWSFSIHRMVLQRKACGWKHEQVRYWAKMQKEADISLFWVVMEDEEKIDQHCSQYPKERSPLLNSATQLDGSTLIPPHTPFTPIGHISLDSSHPDFPSMGNKTQGLYSISRFYISHALQNSGIGRAAMDALELMAQGEPFNAKVLALHTIANEFEGRDERLKAQGRKGPEISLEDWYARRGYVVFGRLDGAWEEVDRTGKMWPCTAVFMRKELVGLKDHERS